MAMPVSMSSARIVDACMRYAASVEYRGVKLEDLCTASGVCERRVRQAFVERYAMPPTARLQFEALLEARRRLLDPPASVDAVTRVALDLGFDHLSRFAVRYRAVFGEPPSATVASARRTPRGHPTGAKESGRCGAV